MADIFEHPINHIINEINAFYNFNYSLQNDFECDTFNNGKYIELYAISKKWLNEWIKHTKYNEIEDYLKNNNKKELNTEKFSKYNTSSLYLPDINSTIKDIYNKNGNIIFNLCNISLINKKCFELFSFGKMVDDAIKAHGLYKKKKLIASLENNCYYIVDYSNNQKKECNLYFDENNKRISKVIEKIINIDNLYNFFNSSKINIYNNQNNQKIEDEEQVFLFEDISFFRKENDSKEEKEKQQNNHINNHHNIHKKTHQKKKTNPQKSINQQNNNYINDTNPCLVGLTNIGATCYMNAVLQCFSNIKHLTNYLFKAEIMKKIEENKDSKIFSFEYLQLIKHLWLLEDKDIEQYGNNKSYSPTQFKNVLGQLNTLFLKNEANDSKDLIIFMQEQLHNELNFILENRNINNNNINNNNINQFNEKEVFTNYSNFFQKNYKSIISDLFYGTQKAVTKCMSCGIMTFNYQIISNMFFPLEAVRQFRQYPNLGNTVYVNFDDCFQYFESNNYLTGQNKISCNYCRNLSDAYYYNKISIAPNILIIILNRGKGLEFNVNLDIIERINISNYVEFKNSPVNYELISIIIHYGNSGQDGHFIAICKNKNDNQWYKYNDSIVTKTNFSEIKKTGIPYVLFYQTVK